MPRIEENTAGEAGRRRGASADAFLELGVPVVDLLPSFLGLDDRSLWVHQTNQHPNETGHAIAAREIFDFLEAQGLLAAR
jgi:hypothetical protein